ncbi:MAG: NUDIX hydrolase, partial [Candidatus Onthomonas sp.]|nr:NUDIX hydrolase [Candidatus Onthomonas sp.]
MKFVSMKKVHEGKFLSRYDIVYETIDGGRKNYEMVSRANDRTEFHQLHDHQPEAVIMIMHDEKKEKILINREFRLAMGEFIYNFPAGLVDEGEDR